MHNAVMYDVALPADARDCLAQLKMVIIAHNTRCGCARGSDVLAYVRPPR